MTVEFSPDRSFQIDGRKFRVPEKPLHMYLKNELASKQARAAGPMKLLLPQAHGFAAGRGTGHSGIGTNLAKGKLLRWLIAGSGVTIIGPAAIWIGSQIYQAIKYGDGVIGCNGDKFVVRSKSWGFTSNEKELANANDVNDAIKDKNINPAAAAAILKKNRDIKCTKLLAAELQQAVKGDSSGGGTTGATGKSK